MVEGLSKLYFTLHVLLALMDIITVPALDADPNGYIVYCPCMGRFGNQADHFLGVLSFSKNINRTLILPPWVEYSSGSPTSTQIPFDRYFLIGPLTDFHRVVTMEKFMKELAPTLWPKEKRISFCWGPRRSLSGEGEMGCHAKDGNPFGPFWDYSLVDFVDSEYYGDLGHYADTPQQADQWRKRFPPSIWPVLAFTGAPASFPVNAKDRHLHKYLKWSTYIADQAKKFVKRTLPEGPFIGIHLRNDIDWDNVCKHVGDGSNQLFASPQCLGYNNEKGKLTMDICKPGEDIVVKQVVNAVKRYNAKSVYVAADKDHKLRALNDALQKIGVRAFRRDPDDPHVSLAILAQSTYYLGNCVSSFSAFAKRERDASGLPSGFWAWDEDGGTNEEKKKNTKKAKLKGDSREEL